MIENTTTLDKKALIALNRALFKRSSLPIVLPFQLVAVNALVFGFFLDDPEFQIVLGASIILQFLIFGLLMIAHVLQVLSLRDRNFRPGTTIHCAFDENGIDFESQNGRLETKGKIAYFLILEVIILKDYVLFFQKVFNPLILAKSNFIDGTAEDLIALLKKNGVKIK